MERGRILIIDSQGTQYAQLSEILKNSGYEVELAQDALKGVGLLNQGGFKVIFVSLHKSFNEGLRNIRGIKLAYPDIGIIALLEKGDIDNLPQVYSAGASEFLPLPLSTQGVTDILYRVLEKYQLKLEYSKVLNEGLEYIDLLNLYQKCMKILTTTDINLLAGLVLEVLSETVQSKKGCIWSQFKEGEEFKKLKSTTEDFPDVPELNDSELRKIIDDGLLLNDKKLWVAIKGNGTRLLGLVCLYVDKNLDEKQENFVKSIMGFASVAFDTAVRSTMYQQFILKDPVTEAYSFSYFTDYVEKELSKSKRFKRNFSIIIIKIDRLDEIRNEFQEYTVNKCLKRLIDILFECVRQTDIVAKKSDDEYYVLLPETDYFGSLVTVRRFNSSIKDKIFLIEGAKTISLPVRISSGTFPRDGGTLDMLLYCIRKRLESQMLSIFKKMNLESKDFWESFNVMVNPDRSIEEYTRNLSDNVEGESRQAIFNESVIKDIAETFYLELNLNSAMRGAFFLKLGRFRERFLSKFSTKVSDSGAFRIYRFETEDITETSPLIRFIRIPSEDAEKGHFLIAVTEDFSYGLFFKEIDKNRYSAFHTSDPYLIENIIAKLQEKYLIYREM
jgi:diguanylate cyclase (GGDEF)-like protein